MSSSWRDWVGSVTRFFGDVDRPWNKGNSLPEIRRAVVDEAESKVVPIAAGKRVFPYNRITVHLLAGSDEDQKILRGVLEQGDWAADLRRAIVERCREKGCGEAEFELKCLITQEWREDFGERHFFVTYDRGSYKEPERPILAMKVVTGEARQRSYQFREGGRFLIGRSEEVMDQHGRLQRRNDLVFSDEGEANTTVSREHARILFHEETDDYWLIDDRSEAGTRIFRDGRAIPVPSRDRRGIRIKDGDLLYFGSAVVSCAIRQPAPAKPARAKAKRAKSMRKRAARSKR